MNVANDCARAHTGRNSELTLLGAIAVAQGPISDIAADTAGGSALVVTNYGLDSVSLINSDASGVDSTVEVGGEPLFAAVADNRVYVGTTSASYDSVAVVDTETTAVIANYPLDLGITGIAVGPDRKRVFVSRAGRGIADVAVIDTTTDDVRTIEIPTRAGMVVDAVRVSPDGQRLFVAMSDTYRGSLVVVDTETARFKGRVTIGSPIRDVAVSPDGAFAYVLAADPRLGGLVDIVDVTTNSIAGTVEIGGFPAQMTLSADGTRAYVVNQMHVTVMCTVTNEVVETIAVGAQPSCVAVSPDGSRLYVADYDGVVTAFSAEPAATLPKFRATAMNVIAAPEVRELQAAAV